MSSKGARMGAPSLQVVGCAQVCARAHLVSIVPREAESRARVAASATCRVSRMYALLRRAHLKVPSSIFFFSSSPFCSSR